MTDRLAAFARSRSAVVLVAGWAFAETILLFIVPDIALLAMVAAAPRTAPVLTLAVIVGAVAGSLVLAALVTVNPQLVQSLLLALPGIDAATIQSVEAEVADVGARAFVAFGPGVPVKVDTYAWTLAGGSPIVLAGAVALNRLTRIGPGILLAAVLGTVAPGFLRRHERLVLAGYVAFWVVLYARYWRVA